VGVCDTSGTYAGTSEEDYLHLIAAVSLVGKSPRDFIEWSLFLL